MAEVHAVAFAIAEERAGLTGSGAAHPVAIAIGDEAVFPDRPEGVIIYISLIVFATDRGASGYGPVDKDGGGSDTRSAEIEVVAYAPLVVPEESLAAIGDMASRLPLGGDEVEYLSPLFGGEQ